MKNYYLFLLFLFIVNDFSWSQTHRVVFSSPESISIEFDFENYYQLADTVIDGKTFQLIRERGFTSREAGEPWLPGYSINIGIPHGAKPQLNETVGEYEVYANKFVIPFPREDPEIMPEQPLYLKHEIYSANRYFPAAAASISSDFVMRYSRIIKLSVSPYQFNPVTREIRFNKKVSVVIYYNSRSLEKQKEVKITDKTTEQFLRSAVVNFNQAVNWVSRLKPDGQEVVSYWYNPQKNFFKIYLKEKGVYRLTYEQLVSSGVPIQQGIESSRLELFNNGARVPLDIVDHGDMIFNSGDYIQFVGYPPAASPYVYYNLYNNSNVYWFSYQNDSLPSVYNYISGFPQVWDTTCQVSKEIIHYERDTLYERLGYAPNDRRDYWYWGRAAAQNGQATSGFQDRFSELQNRAEDSNYIKLRVQMQGLTNSPWCNTDHKAYVDITDQPVGSIIWDGQNTATFEKDIYISEDSIRIFPSGNRLNVLVRGDVCDDIDFDEIRINWYEFEYWRLNRTNPNHYTFKNPVTGMNRYWVWEWQRNNMKIYIPGTSEVIADPRITNDQFNSVLFVHASDRELEYFCTADDYFLNPDSIIEDSPSGLRDLSNGADYIIITHPDFKNAAERLAAFRRSNFPDTTILNARVAVADIFQIYDEFSYGLVDPYALQEFAKYAFGNWQAPAPSYLVLLGDMSYDYRQILPSSRKNYIPSIPYRSFTYGQAASDNMIAAVSGGDIIPDLIIGRLSCESMEEADILVDKIINYPADNRKEWKQNVLLLSSGLDLQDELALGFNDANLELENLYLRPNGLAVTKVFRYPSKPLHEPFRGEGPQIREEINKGAALINYYGHGGGFQWDLVFTNDDILLLENQGLLPVVLSVTCYTAHFDNQEVFGEVFNSVPGKGSIGFFGSSGLTYWGVGKSMNKLFFNDVFNNNNYVIGKAMLNAKVGIGTEGLNESQVALLTYLGDPVLRLALPDKPDFKVTGSDILFTPENPLVKDTINIKVKFRNVGLYIPGDSVLVQLAASSPDTSFLLFNDKLPVAGEYDSLIIEWIPSQGGLYDLEVTINESGTVAEDDRSDNAASASILIFNIREPSIIKPYDGLTADSNKIEFIFADIGHYVNLDLLYHIEIDTSLDFNEPLIKSGPLTPAGGILKWISPVLNPGTYLWRARVSEGSDSGAWSGVRGFTIMQEAKEGYYASGKILKTFDTYNINYLEPQGYLSLNTKLLSPKPSPATFIEDILFGDQVLDSVSLTTLTTDGTYLYFGNMWYFALRDNPEGKSKIYKVGTGNNGTVKGMYYGEVPQFYDRIQNSIFYHSDGFIYVASGSSSRIIKLNPETGDTSSVFIPAGLLDLETARIQDGSFLLTSDGRYIYNLTLYDTAGVNRYTLRILNPENDWDLLKPDMPLASSSFIPGFSGFFVFGNYIYVAEYYWHNEMRRIRIDDGVFEEEWRSSTPFESYYAWTVDRTNNEIYCSVYRASGFEPKFAKFRGEYSDANGTIKTPLIGPASAWDNLAFDLETSGSSGSFNTLLLGLNNETRELDTIAVNIQPPYPLLAVSPDKYEYIQLFFSLTDSSLGSTDPMELRSLNISYTGLPEIVISRERFTVNPDTLIQGLETAVSLVAENIGFSPADSAVLKFYLNNSDSAYHSITVNLDPGEADTTLLYVSSFSLVSDNEIRAAVEYKGSEYVSYNNFLERSFYVVRDSIAPAFKITFDGKEIVDGDFISANPEILISLRDNSPLPIDSSGFTLLMLDNIPVSFSDPDIDFSYSPYPDAEARIAWNPELPDGTHRLEVFGRDASGNYFDADSFSITFNVSAQSDLLELNNYPNPFSNDTYFTFILTGVDPPEEMKINIYTVAGRLIRTLNIQPSVFENSVGFKKIYWNGRDRDGDEIANGIYFYKVIYKNKGVVKTKIQKLAKMN